MSEKGEKSDEKKDGGLLKGIMEKLEGIEKTGMGWYENGGKTEDFNIVKGLMDGAFNGVDGAIRTLLHTPYYFVFLPAYGLWRISYDDAYRTAAMAGLVGIATLPFFGAGGALLAADSIVLGKLLEGKTTQKPTIGALLGAMGGFTLGGAPALTSIFGPQLVMATEGAFLGGALAIRKQLDNVEPFKRVNKKLGLNQPKKPGAKPAGPPSAADTPSNIEPRVDRFDTDASPRDSRSSDIGQGRDYDRDGDVDAADDAAADSDGDD